MQRSTSLPANLKWAGIDLHVHTPASEDYQGPNEPSEYLRIIKRANEFEDPGIPLLSSSMKRGGRPIRSLAFTDHNTVGGFREWRRLYDETASLAEAVRDRDPNNGLLQQLDKDLQTLRSVRVLMGVELNAYPGVHLLLVFHESVNPEAVEAFLADVYGRPYSEFEGKPGPVTAAPIGNLLDLVAQRFGDTSMAIAPHVESGGGLWEVLKELHQVRMAVLKHGALSALSFNKAETREKLKALLSQPDYARQSRLALIQSSDAHGNRGTVGQPRTEVKVADGRPTYTAIRESFLADRLKCSVDFVDEEYARLTQGEPVAKFSALPDQIDFKPEDHGAVASFACAALNSRRGVIQLDLTLRPEKELRQYYPEQVRAALADLLGTRLDPEAPVLLTRGLVFSATRVRILFKPLPLNRLYTIAGVVYVLDNGQARPAHSSEIEIKVAELIEGRFGRRFEKTLKNISEESILLSKMPRGIPLLLRARERLKFFPVKDLRLTRIESTSTRGREIADEARNVRQRIVKESAFGTSKGNTSFLRSQDVRFEEHYSRYLCFTGDVRPEEAEKLTSTRIDKPSIAVTTGGAAVLCEPGYVVAEVPAVLLELPVELLGHMEGCLGWLRSSFFIWYCAVHLSGRDLYQQLQKPDVRLPFPETSQEEFYRRLDGLVRNVLLEERRFLDDTNKQRKRGADSADREKLRTRHNNTINGVCLTMDHDISKALSLTETEIEFVARAIRDMGLTDFGALDQIKNEREARREKEEDGGEDP